MYYLNIEEPMRLFQKTVEDTFFVDKSMLIDELSTLINTNRNYICITRPRRFGKTTNANMLAAFYTKNLDGERIFSKLKISETEDYKKHLNCHNVIHIDFSRRPFQCKTYEEYIYDIYLKLKADIREAYPDLPTVEYQSISTMLEATKDAFIFILDEWDSVFYESFLTEEDKNDYLKFLRDLLKDHAYVELAYMTGVLPIVKRSSGSALNMFLECSFTGRHMYEEYFGFTEEEVQGLCEKQKKVRFEELKEWYDGYLLSDGRSLFNPRSVVFALANGACYNYWTETGPMNEIADCVEHNVDEVREDIVKLVSGIPVEADLDGYSASDLQLLTRDEILSAMTIYGFLTYYDGCLRIPNHELMEKFQRVLSRQSMGEIREIVLRSKEILKATLNCDGQKVACLLEEAHDREIPFLQYNDENSLACVVALCYLAARDNYAIKREQMSGKGYCDFIFVPQKHGLPAIILELKVGKSCEEAISQIKDRNYMQAVAQHEEVLLVGINYDKRTKHHECKIEKWNPKICSFFE